MFRIVGIEQEIGKPIPPKSNGAITPDSKQAKRSLEEIVVYSVVRVVCVKRIWKIELGCAGPRFQRPAAIRIFTCLSDSRIGRSRVGTIARAIAIGRMRFYSVNKNVVEQVLRVFNELANEILLGVLNEVEGVAESQTGHGTIDQHHGFFSGQFLIQFDRIAVKIVEREIGNSVTDMITA